MIQTYPTSGVYPGIPTPKAIELPILQHVADGRRYRFRAIYSAMVIHFDLTPEQERETFPYARGVTHEAPSGSNVFYKYCNNACKALMDKGWLVGEGEYYEDREYEITHRGLKQITIKGERL